MSAKTLCLEHGEKVLFGASVLVLATYVTFGWVIPSEAPLAASVRENIRKAETRLACDDRPPGELTLDLSVPKGWASLADAGPTWDPWIPYWKHKIVPEIIDTGTITRPVLAPPSLEQPKAEVGSVELAWSLNERCTASLSGWTVFRRAFPELTWGEVASLPADARTWSDTKVQTDARYEYRVEAVPDPVAAFEDAGRSSEARAVRTPDGTRLTLITAMSGVATIRVEKYLEGAWQGQPFFVRAGEAIGRDLTDQRGGKLLPLSTGCTLVAVEEAVRTRQEHRTGFRLVQDPLDAKKQVRVPYDEVVEVPERLKKATYQDKDGQVRELWQETGRP